MSMLRVGCAVLLLCGASAAWAESLEEGFAKPPVAAMPGVWWRWIDGNVTRRNTYQGEPPRVRAASSKRESNCRNAASTVRTRNGIATNVWATMTPHVVNGSMNPNQL